MTLWHLIPKKQVPATFQSHASNTSQLSVCSWALSPILIACAAALHRQRAHAPFTRFTLDYARSRARPPESCTLPAHSPPSSLPFDRILTSQDPHHRDTTAVDSHATPTARTNPHPYPHTGRPSPLLKFGSNNENAKTILPQQLELYLSPLLPLPMHPLPLPLPLPPQPFPTTAVHPRTARHPPILLLLLLLTRPHFTGLITAPITVLCPKLPPTSNIALDSIDSHPFYSMSADA